MAFLIAVVLLQVCALTAIADETPFISRIVKASLVFRESSDSSRPYPHVLNVYLRLDNVHDSDISMAVNSVQGVEAELLDSAGKSVPQGPQAASIQSNPYVLLIPYGSRLDWQISHGGISLAQDAVGKYALIVGCRGWLIPIQDASSYSLRIRLRGDPGARTIDRNELQHPRLLLDVPPTKIDVSK